MLTWAQPGSDVSAYRTGATLTLRLLLTLNAWDGAPWAVTANERFQTDHRWPVSRIVRFTDGSEGGDDIEEAAMELVGSVNQYCLLTCSLVTDEAPAASGTGL
ncbi:hypothetical protein JK386_00815 [Nocardioides sp. zg-536]|uniref:Uncharacterized protein n=1 Tax=Nocardioides faecalis TaxID=2803858 RepID=A0A939BX52_9ACTN|nr:hypothetical protein [Nocardioides faecalis]MBM9458440.1 hypothetical protein [Nocardioides faecalis]QVI58454.1 hypothetical protein KG111_15895 [Nocardioides faecalis]